MQLDLHLGLLGLSWKPEMAYDVGAPRDRRTPMISSGSGNRCSCCLEKMRSPSATTSNWPRAPTINSVSTPSACLIEAARLEAFGK